MPCLNTAAPDCQRVFVKFFDTRPLLQQDPSRGANKHIVNTSEDPRHASIRVNLVPVEVLSAGVWTCKKCGKRVVLYIKCCHIKTAGILSYMYYNKAFFNPTSIVFVAIIALICSHNYVISFLFFSFQTTV